MSGLAASGFPGHTLAGFRVGILVLDTVHTLVPGNVQHAASFDFPVLYERVRGVAVPELMQGDPLAVDAVARGTLALQEAGVDIVVGACGSFANYQRLVAGALRIPVFLSVLLEVPMLLRAVAPGRRLGIVFADSSSFTDQVRHECGITDTERIVTLDAKSIPEVQTILAQRGVFDSAALESGLVALARQAVLAHPDIALWLLQCSDFPPYAPAIRHATGRPVFDALTLIRHLHASACRRSLERDWS
jgi:hypothetical protein